MLKWTFFFLFLRAWQMEWTNLPSVKQNHSIWHMCTGKREAECMYLIFFFFCFVEEFNSWPFGYLSSALTNPAGVMFHGRTNGLASLICLALMLDRVMNLHWWIRAASNEMRKKWYKGLCKLVFGLYLQIFLILSKCIYWWILACIEMTCYTCYY